eukprot:CAMPEP_0177751582 /NCGR_PEP_ID=MMETSP0491_2-20121128/449_1 /TAXON_ID=63592 /ORGANISM="Tetraselmis chuii, Strain PLY429" /LENGTH=154 /DNA_ID=CAMNT_0019266701 /DNA_START=184 /DNA_END=648 /DNA_ORIENTATION=+
MPGLRLADVEVELKEGAGCGEHESSGEGKHDDDAPPTEVVIVTKEGLHKLGHGGHLSVHVDEVVGVAELGGDKAVNDPGGGRHAVDPGQVHGHLGVWDGEAGEDVPKEVYRARQNLRRTAHAPVTARRKSTDIISSDAQIDEIKQNTLQKMEMD